jgi:hypothetical protein
MSMHFLDGDDLLFGRVNPSDRLMLRERLA